jgi:hypothetical protein
MTGLRTYELVDVSGGPWPLLNNGGTCCLLLITVLEQGQCASYLVEVVLSDRKLGNVCLPLKRDVGALHTDPGARAWLETLELGKHTAVDTARAFASERRGTVLS